MLGVWIEPVVAQVMMTLPFAAIFWFSVYEILSEAPVTRPLWARQNPRGIRRLPVF